MSGRRRLMMAAGGNDSSLTIEMGLDNRIRFKLVGDTIVANAEEIGGWRYGDIGTHYDLERNYPDLYFGSHKCYADGKVWELKKPLRLGFAPEKIDGVELLESGRSIVTIGDERGSCYIVWGDDHVDVVDDSPSSSRYLIKINFK